MKTTVKSLLIIVALAATPLVLKAQEAPKPATPGSSDRGRFNLEEFKKRMAEQMKTSLKVTDDEWSILSPLVDKVMEKQRDASTRTSFGGRPPGSTGGGDSSRPERAGTAEREALRTTLQNDAASPEEIKNKLGAVRAVHLKSTAELAAAREELRKVVTVRQEAVLVSMGILE